MELVVCVRLLQKAILIIIWASQVVPVVKNLPAKYRRHKRCRFNPSVWKILWRRAWQPTLVLLPR